MKHQKIAGIFADASAFDGQKIRVCGWVRTVRDLVGHGIGTHLHEDPQIPNFPQKRRGVRLMPGMTLAVEPMINLGRADVARTGGR